jgi:hypothetical protein
MTVFTATKGEDIVVQLPQVSEGGLVCNVCHKEISCYRGDNNMSHLPRFGLLQKDYLYGDFKRHKLIDNLTDFEAKLVTPLLVFANIVIARHGTATLRNSLIYVSNDLAKVQRALMSLNLPHTPSDVTTVVVELKRRLSMTNAFCKQTVRPNLLNLVLATLICNPTACPVYADMHIKVDPTWQTAWQPVHDANPTCDTGNADSDQPSTNSRCEYVGPPGTDTLHVETMPDSEDDEDYEIPAPYQGDTWLDNEVRDKHKLLGMKTTWALGGTIW